MYKSIKLSLLVGGVGLFVASSVLAAVTTNLLPTADGTYLQWKPKSGSVHYTQVDETNCNGTTDYVYTSTVGSKDSYQINLSTVPNGAMITKIDILPCASRNSSGGSGSSVMNVFYRYNGSDSANAGAYALSGTSPVKLSTSSFSGLTLSKNSSSTLEIGAVYSSGTKGARLGRIAALITYDLAPTAPSNLTAVTSTGTSTLSVRLKWNDDSNNETGFKVERSNDGVNFSFLKSVGANVSTTYDYSPVTNTVNYYRVYAYNAVGDSGYSNIAAVSLLPQLPAAPTGLVAQGYSASGTGFAYLNWNDNSSDEIDFSVERSYDGVNFSFITATPANQYWYYDWYLTSTNYYYRVNACNGAGCSDYSNVATTTVP